MRFPPNEYTDRCPVCSLPARTRYPGGVWDIDCSCCGTFKITDIAHSFLPGRLVGRQVALASWFLRQNEGFTISSENITLLEQIRPLDVAKRGLELLVSLASMFPDPGSLIPTTLFEVNPNFLRTRTVKRDDIYAAGTLAKKLLDPLKLLAVSASQNEQELTWLVQGYLQELGYLRQKVSGALISYEITIEGWKVVESSGSTNKQSKIGFIAMPFAQDFIALYEQALHPGIFDAGYQPLRIDSLEHNNRIDDEIVACIRKSRFVVADLSLNRGGIYFEAGYALGLGLPVIWTVKRSALNEVHFDNRQYNFLTWEESKYSDLARRITNRIEATIGRPY